MSPVSTTQVTCIAPVIDTGKSMTPVSNFLPVSWTPVKLSKTVKVSLTGVVDTGEELLTGVNDAGNACFAAVVDTSEAPEKSNIYANILKNQNCF